MATQQKQGKSKKMRRSGLPQKKAKYQMQFYKAEGNKTGRRVKLTKEQEKKRAKIEKRIKLGKPVHARHINRALREGKPVHPKLMGRAAAGWRKDRTEKANDHAVQA